MSENHRIQVWFVHGVDFHLDQIVIDLISLSFYVSNINIYMFSFSLQHCKVKRKDNVLLKINQLVV